MYANGIGNPLARRTRSLTFYMLLFISTKLTFGIFLALNLLLFVPTSVAVIAQDDMPEVLVLHSFRATNPANADWFSGIVEGLTTGSERPIQIDVDASDLTRFEDAAYMSDLLDVYRRKYRNQQPDLIIPTYTPALKFLLEHAAELFPGVPIVFCAADSGFVAAQVLPAHITGITSTLDIKGTIELALQIQPNTERVAVVVGAGVVDRGLEFETRKVLAQFEDKVETQWLRALSIDDLNEAVRQLPERTVILFLIQNEDRTGKPQVPMNVLRQMSEMASVPIYGLWDTLIGHDIVGGRMLTMHADGVVAGQLGLKVLSKVAPSDIPIIHRKQSPAIFDGQVLARWNIDENLLPTGSRILNREPSVWDQYRTEITVIALVVSLQALLIVALVINRMRLRRTRTELQQESDRRRQAEVTALQFRDELDKFSKERFLGAIATTIAHEINQPLIAIQNYAQAAKRRAAGEHSHVSKLIELLGKIEGQAGRAGDIIMNVRGLVHADEADTQPASLNAIVGKVLDIMESELEIRARRVEYFAEANLPEVFADQLQIQLVLVNLLRNAMKSMAAQKDRAGKAIRIEVRRFNSDQICVSVTDWGVGISSQQLEVIFEPMYSQSTEGMGMGLAICRMIIDAHHGRIWCESNPNGGACFHFTLQAVPA